MASGPRLGAHHIREVVDELAPLVTDLRVVQVEALPPRDLLLVLQPEGEPDARVTRVRVSADPDSARVHLQTERVHKHRGPVGPFFRRLSEELGGARLRKLTQIAGDRLVGFELRDEEQRTTTLIAELCGRHANLVWLDGKDIVLDLLVPTPGKEGVQPRLEVGSPWRKPPGQPRADGRPVAEDFVPDESVEDCPAPVSRRIELLLGAAARLNDRERTQRRLRERLGRKLKRARSNLRGLERRASAADGSERILQDGELLKGQLHQVQRGMKAVTVQDYYADDAPDRVIELDPKLSPSDNVERLFARHRKLVRSAAHLPEEMARAQARIETYEAFLERVEDDSLDPDELEREALESGLLEAQQEADPRRRKAPVKRLPYKVFHSGRGLEIWVGRSARDNDQLTLRHARGNDQWLHTRDAPGSHVVLRTERGSTPDPEDLLDAAALAVHFSPLRGASRADVHVVPCKQVKKPKGAPPGLVQVAGGKNLHMRSDPERLQRLLDRRPPESRA